MECAEKGVADDAFPGILLSEHMFWRRFDIPPGIWKYKYRVGQTDCIIYDFKAEQGNHFHTPSSDYKLTCSSQGWTAQAKSIMFLE